MFNEGHDLIFVEKKKTSLLRKKMYFSAGGGKRKKWIRFMAKTNTLLELVKKQW